MRIKNDLLLTLMFLVIGMLIIYLLDFNEESFYLKYEAPEFMRIFINNFIICMLILFIPRPYKNVIYYYNITFMGMVVYIMIVFVNDRFYFYAPLEFFTIMFTYLYASYSDKKVKCALLITILLIVSALIESRLII